MLTFPYLLSWPQRRSGRWPGIIVSLCLACFFCLTTARLAYAQQFITVNTTALTVDGATGSVAALLADPGRDGNISLAEAVAAINNTGPGHTIRFAPALGKGATIYFTAPVIFTANNTAINGDFDQDDRPDIVLDGPDNGFTLVIRSSGNRLVNLAFIGVVIEGAAAQNNEIVRNYIGPDGAGRGDLTNRQRGGGYLHLCQRTASHHPRPSL